MRFARTILTQKEVREVVMVEKDVHKVEVRKAIENPEFRAHLQELYERLPAYAERVASVPPEQPYSAEWLGRVGRFCWRARERSGLSRREVAQRAGVPINLIRFLEVGLVSHEELNENALLRQYAEALGQPELLGELRQRFGVEV